MLTQDHMWLGISMSARLYESIGDYGGMQATIFRVNRPSFKNIVTLKF